VLRITPFESTRTMVGTPSTFHCLATMPLWPSAILGHGSGWTDRNSFNVAASSRAIPRMANGRLLYSTATFCRSCGIMARHGAHHVAQKSTRTTLPLKSLSRTGLPSGSVPAISGHRFPVRMPSGGSASVNIRRRATTTPTKPRRKMISGRSDGRDWEVEGVVIGRWLEQPPLERAGQGGGQLALRSADRVVGNLGRPDPAPLDIVVRPEGPRAAHCLQAHHRHPEPRHPVP